MFGNRLVNTNAGGGGCTNTVDLYNPFPDGGGIALYQLNGDATDVSGNYDGTATNVTYGAGQFGQAGVFNGSSSRIATNITNSVIPVNSDFSISCWIYIGGTSDFIIAEGNWNAWSTAGFGMELLSDNRIELSLGNNGSSGGTQITSAPITLNTWTNVVGTVSIGNSLKLYVNGSEVSSTSLSGNSRNSVSGGFYIGSDLSGFYYNGSIDQVRFFNRALRPYEVEALYTEEYCTPTIVPSEHFNTVTYTGNQSTQSITGVGFQPDFVWIKERTSTSSHALSDSIRGTSNILVSNSTAAADTSNNQIFTGFDFDGFSVGNNNQTNENGQSYVSWNFKAAGYDNTFNVLENGSTTSSATAAGAGITAGSNTTNYSVSANRDAGFSVVKFDAGSTAWNVGHGLNVAPSVIIEKMYTFGNQWAVYHKDLGTGKFLNLSTTNGTYTDSGAFSSVTDTTYTSYTTLTSGSYIAYCFAEVEGFSSFGSYVGTGTSKTVVTGFEPAFVMFKVTSEADHWLMFDNKRGVVTDSTGTYLIANLSQAEGSILPDNIRFLQNGFEITGSGRYWNKANASYIYMAFAADPTAVEPTLEDSFNTVVYSGDGTTNHPITGVGFQPDFTWIKDRNVDSHRLFDSIRGANNRLYSNSTSAESPTTDSLLSFDDNGFTVGSSMAVNESGTNNYVSWNWKGAELPAINSNGSIPSVVSANPAAGFSISTYSGKTGGGTTGHGLNSEPEFIIFKRYTAAQNWFVFAKINNVWNILEGLNTNNAATDYSPYFSANDSIINWYNANEYNSDPASSYLAYSFHSVAGFSKFGSYSGGSTGSGNVIDVGFKPLFLMVKRTDAAGDAWQMFDTVRGGGDTFDNYVQANTSAAEVSYNQREVNFTNNGFYWTYAESGTNISGGTYIYMAFANQF